MKKLIYLCLIVILASCGSTRSKDEIALWTSIPNPNVNQISQSETRFYTLNETFFIDSLFNHPESVVLPMPDMDGEFYEYTFKEVYDVDNKPKENFRGFIGRNVRTPSFLVTLYVIDGEHVTAKWKLKDASWILNSVLNEEKRYYRLIQAVANKNNELKFEYETY